MKILHVSTVAAAATPLALALLTGCAPGADDPTAGQQSANLVGAGLDAHHQFDVGVCAGPLTGGADANHGTCQQAGTRCSGTLIAPNLVLTARHCVYQVDYAAAFCDSTFSTRPLSTAPVRITPSDSVLVGNPSWYTVDEIRVPEGNGGCSDDLALLVLHTPVPASQVLVAGVSLERDLATHPPHEVAIVGRGGISDTLDLTTFDETTVDGDFRRREVQHIPFVCASDSGPGCTGADFSSPPSNTFTAPPSLFTVAAQTAPGDSGSAVFDQSDFTHIFPSVIGVVSASTYGPDGHPNAALATRLDRHETFIRDGYLAAWRHLVHRW